MHTSRRSLLLHRNSNRSRNSSRSSSPMPRKSPNKASSSRSPSSSTPSKSPSKPDKPTWEELKTTGNSFFSKGDFSSAISKYTEAIKELEASDGDNNNNNNNEKDVTVEELGFAGHKDLARIYSNRAAAHANLAEKKSKFKETAAEHLRESVKDGEMAVKLDYNFQKGHYRVAYALLKLGEDQEKMMKHVEKILNLYQIQGTEYHEDKKLTELLKEAQYFSSKRTSSPNWEHVKYKDNFFVLDAHGAGDFTTISNDVFKKGPKVSLLVKPGHYKITESIQLTSIKELDVVGDVDKKEDDVIITLNESIRERQPCHIFSLVGGKLNLRKVHLRQCSEHPEIHAIFALRNADIELNQCVLYSKVSACLGMTDSSRLYLRECKFDGCCGGVIVVDQAQVNIHKCKFEKTVRIGVEVRDRGFATISKTEISNCGRQAISCHAGGQGFIAEECVIYNNMRSFGDQERGILLGSGYGMLDRCQIVNNKGGGVMVCDGARATIKECTISGGKHAVGFSTRGTGEVRDCKISNVSAGFCILANFGGEITLQDNKFQTKCPTEVYLGPGDVEPTMIGPQHKIVEHGPGLGRAGQNTLNQMRQARRKDKFVPGQHMDDPRKYKSEGERVCRPCGMSQRAAGKKFHQCDRCRLDWYCSKECQIKHWPIHQLECKTLGPFLKKK